MTFYTNMFDGNPNACNVYWNDAKRKSNLNWHSNFGNSNDWFAFRDFLHFSLVFTAGEFCFVSCPLQPPSILPISSICRDIAIYFLLSNDLASHKTIKSILSVSTFLIANLTHICFSSRDKKVAIEIASITLIKIVSIFCPRVYLCILGRV